MDGGAWLPVHGVSKSQIQVSMNAHILVISSFFFFFQVKCNMVVKKTNSGAKPF